MFNFTCVYDVLAVSYTHLDVYKRQDVQRLRHSGKSTAPDYNIHKSTVNDFQLYHISANTVSTILAWIQFASVYF